MTLLQNDSLLCLHDSVDTDMMISFIDSLVVYRTSKIILHKPKLCDAINWLHYLSTHQNTKADDFGPTQLITSLIFRGFTNHKKLEKCLTYLRDLSYLVLSYAWLWDVLHDLIYEVLNKEESYNTLPFVVILVSCRFKKMQSVNHLVVSIKSLVWEAWTVLFDCNTFTSCSSALWHLLVPC